MALNIQNEGDETMKHITRTTFQLLFSLSLVACLTVWLAPVAAAHTTIPDNGPNQVGNYFITHVAFTGDEARVEYNVYIAPGTGANITKTWSVSNSFGATIGINADVVSAGLSYNVTTSTDVSETCTANVNTTGFDQLLGWQSLFANQSYDIYWHSNFTGQDTKEGTGWAKEYTGPRCDLSATVHVMN
jgi:hypothetical protein